MNNWAWFSWNSVKMKWNEVIHITNIFRMNAKKRNAYEIPRWNNEMSFSSILKLVHSSKELSKGDFFLKKGFKTKTKRKSNNCKYIKHRNNVLIPVNFVDQTYLIGKKKSFQKFIQAINFKRNSKVRQILQTK